MTTISGRRVWTLGLQLAGLWAALVGIAIARGELKGGDAKTGAESGQPILVFCGRILPAVRR